MTTTPPVAVAIRFIDCINRGDLVGLTALMTDDHRLEVFDEPPVSGRDANRVAWRGYIEAFPNYVIHPILISQTGNVVAVLGSTTGSHLGLPDDEERRRTLIWLAHVRDDLVERWMLVGDSPENRASFQLDQSF